jgi:hypothetical protein
VRARRDRLADIRERRLEERASECMKTFVAALERAGKPPHEIERLSKLYQLRLDRARREMCL